jgi:ribosomal protein RSM22 (predicted rRNA methylase)
MGVAIARVAHPSWYGDIAGAVARSLPEALRNCNALSFSQVSEAAAYAGLHLLDRYGRVMQVLEHLIRVGRLPLRKMGVKVLEVGSGPAPALYASRDFYAMLRAWPGRGNTEVAPVEFADSLERGEAWDRVLHHVSECLMEARGGSQDADCLPFSRAIKDLSGFDTIARHHQSVAQRARQIFKDFDSVDEYITPKAAARMAYGEGGSAPSAYDLVFMCNFLTQPSMTVQFSSELRKLSRALTPGGVLVIMGGTGGKYPEIYDAMRSIASEARLTDISPPDILDANFGPHLGIVCSHTRANVKAALAECDEKERADICSKLPLDLWNPGKAFVLPKYQTLAFVRQ